MHDEMKRSIDLMNAKNGAKFLCPKDGLPAIKGRFQDSDFNYLQIRVKGCNITADDSEGRVCQDPENLAGKYFNFLMMNAGVNLGHGDEEKIAAPFTDCRDHVRLDPDQTANLDIFLSPVEIDHEEFHEDATATKVVREFFFKSEPMEMITIGQVQQNDYKLSKD